MFCLFPFAFAGPSSPAQSSASSQASGPRRAATQTVAALLGYQEALPGRRERRVGAVRGQQPLVNQQRPEPAAQRAAASSGRARRTAARRRLASRGKPSARTGSGRSATTSRTARAARSRARAPCGRGTGRRADRRHPPPRSRSAGARCAGGERSVAVRRRVRQHQWPIDSCLTSHHRPARIESAQD